MDNEIYSSQSWSVKMEADGELPPLTQEDIEQILVNPYDPDHIRAILDTRKLLFNGLMFVWAEDITRYFQVNRFQKRLATNTALLRRRDLQELQQQLRSDLQLPQLEIGFLFKPFATESRQACLRPHLRSLRFTEEIELDILDPQDTYRQAFHQPIIINALSNAEGLDAVKQQGLESLLIAPLVHHDEVIGLVEFGSTQSQLFLITPRCRKS